MDQERQGKQQTARSRAAALCGLSIAAVLFGNIPAASGAPTKNAPAVHLAVLPAPGVQAVSADVGQHDFGTVSLLAPALITETFTVRNGTRAPLVLDHLQPSCGCIAAAVTRQQNAAPPVKQIAPGQSISVKVLLDPTGLEPGPLHKTIWVFTQGQDAPAATLVMVGNLLPAASFSPQVINFGSVAAGTKLSQLLTVTLDPKLLPAGTVTKVSSSDPSVEVVPVPSSAAGAVPANGQSQRQYRVTLLPDAYLGILSSRISLSVTASGAGGASSAKGIAAGGTQNGAAFVTGEVAGDISALPATLAFGTVAAGKQATQQAFLLGLAQSGLAAATDNPYLTARLQIGGQKPLLVVTLSRLAPVGPLSGNIIVKTQNGQRLRVPVFALITPSETGT